MTARGDAEALAATFALKTSWSDIPPAARARVTDLALDAIACAVTGRDAPARDTVASAVRALFGGGDSLVIRDEPASPAAAAFLNGWQTTATTMCDVYRPRMCHVTPVVLPALLASATDDTPVTEALAAFAVGIELTVRLCDAMDPVLYTGARWHSPGVIGPYGGATTAARLAGADAGLLRRAWGAAGQHSGGTFAVIGSPGVKTTQGRGAQAGVVAAGLAAYGHGGHPDAWSHPDGGLFAAYDAGDTALATSDFGERWALLGISLRRWPASSSLQTVIESVLALRTADAPISLEVRLPRASFKLCSAVGWDDQLSALQSARWVAAATWLDGDCWLDQFADARRADQVAGDLAAAVTVTEDPTLAEGAAIVTAVRFDGTSETVRRDLMPGSPTRPLGRDEIVAKLSRAGGSSFADELVAALTGSGTFAAVRRLLR